MSLSSLFGVFKGFFSQTFWFGSFLPLAIFAALNLVAVAFAFPAEIDLDDWASLEEKLTNNLFVSIVALVVLAYAVAPTIQLLRATFDGTLLPAWLHDFLRQERGVEAAAMRADLDAAAYTYDAYIQMIEADGDVAGRLGAANASGLGAIPPDAGEVTRLLSRAADAVSVLAARIATGAAPDPDWFEDAATPLEAALAAMPADRQPTLLGAKLRFDELLLVAREDADHRWRTVAVRQKGLSLNNPQATRIGDARVTVESYSKSVYGVDFDYVWPRLQLVIPKDSRVNERIGTAQSQLDFATLSLALALIFPVIWVPLFAVASESAWPALLVGAAAPTVALFLYQLLFESQVAFGEVVKLAIDEYRLDLLTKVLRQPLPATLSAERALWGKLQVAEEPNTPVDLVYHHPAT